MLHKHFAKMKLIICFLEISMTKRRQNVRYIKMHGRKIYEFALTNVPNAMKLLLIKVGFLLMK